ncbi:MAG: DUF4474 domain-containing protein [Vallitaleaceae bacterium]|nr:DUF4474 domain-containing protein [Vallitaleaceae bacterium]
MFGMINQFILFSGVITFTTVAIIMAVVILILSLFTWLMTSSRLIKKIKTIPSAVKAFIFKSNSVKDQQALDEIVEDGGYQYDPKQDIFFSHLNAWQRKYGYCRLYDEAAAPLGMIIDSEPAYFEYAGKRWLLEMWKGQYDLTTGCEIGLYKSEGPDLNIPGLFKGGFYECVDDDEMLEMAYTLKKNGTTLFTRVGRHWWLTGFKLGLFSEPAELTMFAKINFTDPSMCHAYVEALKKLGYGNNDLRVNNWVVHVKFEKPYSTQPATRVPEIDELIQKKNKLMCESYQELTKSIDNTPDKLNAFKAKEPVMYKEMLKIGKPKQLFAVYESLKHFLK